VLDASVTRARVFATRCFTPTHSRSATTGTYLPGLAYTAKNGQSRKTVARSPADLLDLAARIEQAIDPLSRVRDAVNKLPLPALRR